METTNNYLKEYYKNKTHDLTSLINKNTDNEENIKSMQKEILKLEKSLLTKKEELHNELEKAYSSNFSPLTSKVIIRYLGRTNQVFYDFESGDEVNEPNEEDIVYTISNKRGDISVVVGYSYELASIIIKDCSYYINKDNTKIKFKLLKEKVLSFMEPKVAVLDVEEQTVIERESSYQDLKALDSVKGKTFINNMYNVEYEGDYTLYTLRDCNLKNKSFEIILKTCPKEIMHTLLNYTMDKAIPIHKIIGVSLEIYNKAVSRNEVRLLLDNKNYINGSKNEFYDLDKTESEWFDLIEEMQSHEEDLEFYDISYCLYYGDGKRGDLLELLLNSYRYKGDVYDGTYGQIFRKYYSFGKFANYVINETINQGYTRVRSFIGELGDYLRMCDLDNIKPTLYSSYLKQTHDITSRNHKIKVEEENEKIFKNRYENFKEYKGNDYMVVAPKDSNDLKLEGDVLNHCVASYIKRVIDGECLIYFLRKNKDESLITFEVRHDEIVQVRGLHNRRPNEKEIKALKDFAKYRKLGCNF